MASVYSATASTAVQTPTTVGTKLKGIDPVSVIQTFDGHKGEIHGLGVFKDLRFVTCSADQTIKKWYAYSTACEKSVDCKDLVRSLATLNDQNSVAFCKYQFQASQQAQIYNLSNDAHTPLEQSDVSMFAVSEDGLLASASGLTLMVWDLNAPIPKCLHIYFDKKTFNCAAFLPDKKTLVSAHFDGTIQFWDLSSDHKTPFKTFQKNSAPILSVAVMKDGTIATGSEDYIVRLWDPSQKPDQALKKELTGHHGVVNSLAVRSDNTLVSGGDKTIILWDTETGKSWQSAEEPASIVKVAVLENDMIVTAAWDGSLKLWK